MYENLLFDADGTLYDFKASEDKAITMLWDEFKLPEGTQSIYQKWNNQVWSLFEQGKITIQALKVKRFENFLNEIGSTNLDPSVISDHFLKYLSQFGILYDQSREVLLELKSRGYHIYIVTNGVKDVQKGRFTAHKEEGLFEAVFCSEELNSNKPQKEFFDKVFQILNFDDESIRKTIIIGDSLTSDIQGGINAGIPTVWFNRHNRPVDPNIKPTYEIHQLKELLDMFPKIK